MPTTRWFFVESALREDLRQIQHAITTGGWWHRHHPWEAVELLKGFLPPHLHVSGSGWGRLRSMYLAPYDRITDPETACVSVDIAQGDTETLSIFFVMVDGRLRTLLGLEPGQDGEKILGSSLYTLLNPL